MATEATDDVTLAHALAGEGYVEFRHSHLAQAQAKWESALKRAESAGEDRVAAGILRSLAIAAASGGRQDETGELIDRAITLARSTGDDQQLRLLLGSAAERNLWLGDYQAPRTPMETPWPWPLPSATCPPAPCCWPSSDGWLCCGAMSSPPNNWPSRQPTSPEVWGTAACWPRPFGCRARPSLRRGGQGAAAVLERALRVAEELGAPAEVAGVRCSQACLALEEERWPEARSLARMAGELSALPHPMRRVSLRWVLGTVALMEGDLTSAEGQFRADLEATKAGKVVRHQANSYWGLAGVSAASGHMSRAVGLHQRALLLRHRMGDRLGVVDSLIGLATVMAPVEPDAAARLIGAAADLRSGTGARATQARGRRGDCRHGGDAARPPIRACRSWRKGQGIDVDEDAVVAMAARLGVPDGYRARSGDMDAGMAG